MERYDGVPIIDGQTKTSKGDWGDYPYQSIINVHYLKVVIRCPGIDMPGYLLSILPRNNAEKPQPNDADFFGWFIANTKPITGISRWPALGITLQKVGHAKLNTGDVEVEFTVTDNAIKIESTGGCFVAVRSIEEASRNSKAKIIKTLEIQCTVTSKSVSVFRSVTAAHSPNEPDWNQTNSINIGKWNVAVIGNPDEKTRAIGERAHALFLLMGTIINKSLYQNGEVFYWNGIQPE
ncbi:MAG: hypothetical protein H7A40_01535 [Chlamydiales bacterium]|nr:hypothetical protein [Chlamydiales bacterium]